VKVEAKTSELPDKKIRVTFQIDEGPKLVIRRISFTGNDSVLPKDLLKVMKTKTANLLLPDPCRAAHPGPDGRG